MGTQLTRADLAILDPDTYANGDPSTYGLPLEQYAYLRDHEPVSLHEFPDDPLLVDKVWVISRHEDIEAVDRDFETFTTTRGTINIWSFAPIGEAVDAPAMLTQDGPEHRATRRVVSRAFTPKLVQQLEDKFREYAIEVIEPALAKGEAFNFVDDIAHTMPMQALGDVLGVPEEDRPKFFGWVDKFASPFDPRMNESFEEVGESIAALWAYALELEKIRRDDPGDDVMSRLAEAHFPDNQVRGNTLLLASGAAESTRAALSHGLHQMLRNPDQMQWLRDHADDIPLTAAQEMVRIATPFTHLCRVATRDVEMHGQVIPEGDQVAMLFASGNFDPDAIEDPTTFDLSRAPNPHLSFGRGPHSCLGKHVAALEIKVLMEELMRRTKDIRQVGEVSYMRDAYTRGIYELPVEMTAA